MFAGSTRLLALRGEPQTHPRLHQRRLRLLDAQLEISGSKDGDDLAFLDRAAEVHADLGDPAGDFEGQRDLFFGGQRPGDRDRAYSVCSETADGLDRPWRRRRPRPGPRHVQVPNRPSRSRDARTRRQGRPLRTVF